MKLLKSLLALNTFTILSSPVNIMILNGQQSNHFIQSNYKLLEMDSLENLFDNIIMMVETNKFWDQEKIKFDHWKDEKSEVKNYFNSCISELYEKYFDQEMYALVPLRSEMTRENEIKSSTSRFTNDSASNQKWKTPGFEWKVSNQYRYSITSEEIQEGSFKLTIDFGGMANEGSYSIKSGESESTTTRNTVETTEMYPPEVVNVKPYMAGIATYRIYQGHGFYYGMLSTVNNQKFELKIPTFFTQDGSEVKIVLTAKDLLMGLKKAGFDLQKIGKSATHFSIISYDDRFPIEETEHFSYNIETEWEADISRISMKYDQFPLNNLMRI